MKQLGVLGRQLGRFSLVGLSNTAVDVVVTNVLYLWIRPDGQIGLLAISVAACLLAIGNSYLLNSRWTFAQAKAGNRSSTRFVATALVGMVINTMVFMFLMRHLPLLGLGAGLVVLNLARAGGVAAAMAVTFCGYRLWVFVPHRSAVAAHSHPDEQTLIAPFPVPAVLGITMIALVVRLAFVAAAPVIYGDAVNYAWVARLTATGNLAAVDLFWHSLFDFWQAVIVWLGAGQFSAPVIASLVPGVLLVWPVALITFRLYGGTVAQLAATIAALHPRLIEYSTNGYAETFYLLGALWAIWGVLTLATEPRRRGAIAAAGLGFAAWILVRNEAVLFAGGAVAFALLLRQVELREVAGAIWRVAVIVCVSVGAYALLNTSLWGETGLVQKSSNLARQHTEMLDMREAARETYGAQTAQTETAGAVTVLETLVKRWPANVRYTLERLPGMLLSPLFLFAMLLPLLQVQPRPGQRAWPVLWMTLWPLAFYPLIQLEPRMLFPTLLGVTVLGSAGLVAAGRRLSFLFERQRQLVRRAPAVAVLLLLVPLIPLVGWHTSAERGFHRAVGNWIAEFATPVTNVIGDGYGYVSASSFWAGRQASPRIWTDDIAALAASVDESAVLLLYERYLREANPELLTVLDDGLPGMIRVAEFEFPRVGRVQAWRSLAASP